MEQPVILHLTQLLGISKGDHVCSEWGSLTG